jgi:hypothetical protein
VPCQSSGYPLDQRLGAEGSASEEAERLLCLAGSSWSFEVAAQRLQEFLGWTRCSDTLRQTCYRRGRQIEQWRESQPTAHEAFREATGDVEFETDGTCVNTQKGWREMRLAIFCKRQRGGAASVANWDKRRLPPPHARVAFAAIEPAKRFGRRWKSYARRLGILDTSRVTVLADGAAWIWEEKIKHLRGSSGVLDAYHAFEHLSQTAGALYGERTVEASQWTDQGRQALLEEGWSGIERHLSETRRQSKSIKKRAVLQKLWNYLQPHADHLNYPTRLAEGRTIGSGLVEGGCKQIVGRRLKQTGARWRVANINAMATLCCAASSSQWDVYWTTAKT